MGRTEDGVDEEDSGCEDRGQCLGTTALALGPEAMMPPSE